MNSIRSGYKLGRTVCRLYTGAYIPASCKLCSKSSGNDSKPGTTNKKYTQFHDEELLVVLDVEEEMLKRMQEKEGIAESPGDKETVTLSQRQTRGIAGVFDIEELVDFLHENKASNIFVAQVPEHLNYANHIVVASANSRRHIIGLGETVRKLFKSKRNSNDHIPKLEGESSEWIALDLGNIILHIMSPSCREVYDLESLWGIGPTFDEHANKTEDTIHELLKLHSISLDGLEPRK